MERYTFDEECVSGDRATGVRVPARNQVYVIYDRRRGYYDPLCYLHDATDAQMIIDALNTSHGVVNTPDATQ